MKCVIFCGGKGIRMDSENVPKPLLKVGDRPILEHIINHFASFGVNEFVLCLGHEGEKIRFHFFRNPSKYRIEMADTGEDSSKAQRLLQVKHLVGERFYVSYGDDISDIDLSKLSALHGEQGKIATLSAVKLPNPFGVLEIDDFEPYQVTKFKEKPIMENWINGGYYLFEKKIFDYIEEEDDLEKEVFQKLINEKQLGAYRHSGFWMSMNTLKDHVELNEMYNKGELDGFLKKNHL